MLLEQEGFSAYSSKTFIYLIRQKSLKPKSNANRTTFS